MSILFDVLKFGIELWYFESKLFYLLFKSLILGWQLWYLVWFVGVLFLIVFEELNMLIEFCLYTLFFACLFELGNFLLLNLSEELQFFKSWLKCKDISYRRYFLQFILLNLVLLLVSLALFEQLCFFQFDLQLFFAKIHSSLTADIKLVP